MSDFKLSITEKDKNNKDVSIYIETKNLETINIFYSSMYIDYKDKICLGLSYFDENAKKKLFHKEITYKIEDEELLLQDWRELRKLMALKWEEVRL